MSFTLFFKQLFCWHVPDFNSSIELSYRSKPLGGIAPCKKCRKVYVYQIV